MPKIKKIALIASFIICMTFLSSVIQGVLAQTSTPSADGSSTYTIYGGSNPDDSLSGDWSASSDNVVWDFGQTGVVYRLIKSLSLKYNPRGYFQLSKSTQLDLTNYKYLTLAGRAGDEQLDFSINFLDTNNQPVGRALSFSNYGGTPDTHYWTQYNFPISDFYLPTSKINGLRISQLSSGWGAVLYIDELYISDVKGEYINPAQPSVTPTPAEESGDASMDESGSLGLSPWIFVIPLVVLLLVMFFH